MPTLAASRVVSDNLRRRALAAFGLVLRAANDANLSTSPSFTAGAGAPSAAEPDGSVYLRTDGASGTTLYLRVSSAWVATGAVIPADAELAAIAGLTSAANKMIRFTGSGTAELLDLTAAGAALLDDAAAVNQRTTLGLAIGTDVQAFDAELAAIAGLTSAANKMIRFTGSGTAELLDLTAAGAALLDDAAAVNQRTTLGLAIGTDVQAYSAVLAALAAAGLNDEVKATVTLADGTGGTNTALLSVQLYQRDGTTPITAARQFHLLLNTTQYGDAAGPSNASLSLGTVTAGSIIATVIAGCLYLVETSAAGLFGCTATNTDDETVYASAKSASGGVSDNTKACAVFGSTSDPGTWSA